LSILIFDGTHSFVDNRDEDDYDEEEEEGSDGEYSDDGQGSDNEEEENIPVGLTPQQQELLQIVSQVDFLSTFQKMEGGIAQERTFMVASLFSLSIFRPEIGLWPKICERNLSAGNSALMKRN
jgi:hypothetical protein